MIKSVLFFSFFLGVYYVNTNLGAKYRLLGRGGGIVGGRRRAGGVRFRTRTHDYDSIHTLIRMGFRFFKRGSTSTLHFFFSFYRKMCGGFRNTALSRLFLFLQ